MSTPSTAYRNPVAATFNGLLEMLRSRQRIGKLGPLDRLDGLNCLITGASSGLGQATAIALARRGARLIIAGRGDLPAAADQIRRQCGSSAVDTVHLDLADLASVRACCDELRSRGLQLDRLVLNAGLMPRRSQLSAQGFEIMFGVHFLGNLTLTRRLLSDGTLPNSSLAGNAPNNGQIPRIVVVSSESHRSAGDIDFTTFADPVDYGAMGGMAQYGRSKLLLTALALELSRRLRCNGHVDVAVHCLCPGPVNSNIAREAPAAIRPLLGPLMKTLFASPRQAAEPVEFLICSRAIEGRSGLYLHRMTPRLPAQAALDPAIGTHLWQAGSQLAGFADN